MDLKNDYIEYSINVMSSSVKLSYATPLADYEIATYLFRLDNGEPILLEKLWYQRSVKDRLIKLESGKYYFLFYFRKIGEKNYSFNKKSNNFNIKILSSFVPNFFDPRNTRDILRDLVDKNLNDIDFGSIRSAKHGSVKVSKEFYTTLCKNCLDIILDFPEIKSSRSFLLNCIFYIGTPSFLFENKEKLILILINSTSICLKKDLLFWYGLMMYKLENYVIAEQAFEKLINFKVHLSYHQTGALSYLSDTGKFLDKEFTSNKINYIYKSLPKNYKGCILISCDFGYFSAYLKEILYIFDKNLIVHLHFILPNNVEELNLNEISEKYENIFVSYEFIEETIGNTKTYFSVSRYLILPEILNRYNLPTIIADADLDFSNLDLKSVVKSVNDNEISLRITDSDLPWLKVTAGFNVFGKNTYDASFLKILTKYIRFCFETGRDGWMLDQTALGQCLYFYNTGLIEEKPNFKISKISLDSSVKQVSNRAKKRVEAQQALSSLNYH